MQTASTTLSEDIRDLVSINLSASESYVADLQSYMISVLRASGSQGEKICISSHNAPRLSPPFWLLQLRRDNFEEISHPWKKVIITYGLVLTGYHRAKRLAAMRENKGQLAPELRQSDHSSWDPEQFPETFLLEVESEIMIREEQESIASNMRTPKDNRNIVLQLLMGAGKSSTIVPILAAFLGDKKTSVGPFLPVSMRID